MSTFPSGLFAALLFCACAAETKPLAAPAAHARAVTAEGYASNAGVHVRYRVQGAQTGAPLLLISGTGSQLIDWPDSFVGALVAKGFLVITFDNRDTGLSTTFDPSGPPDWTKVFTAIGAGAPVPLAYTAQDMAADAVAVLETLKISQAHLVGFSGGAIVAEIVAASYPSRTLSLTAMAANSGNPAYRMPAQPQRLVGIPPAPAVGADEATIVDRQVKAFVAIGSLTHPRPVADVRAWALQSVRRKYEPAGGDRQGAAMLVAGDLRTQLRTIAAPTVVIHGDEDPLIPVELGRDVANSIPNARFMLVHGMGHDLPDAVVPQLIDAICTVVGGRR
jgi:pimeloyl-ACP methyl ester carboxylesterase